MHLCSTSIIKITVNKMAISPECFVCIRWDLQNWKNQSSNLTVGTEGITQLLKSNFEWPKCKWKHQCHAFVKKGTFFWTCLSLSFLYFSWHCWPYTYHASFGGKLYSNLCLFFCLSFSTTSCNTLLVNLLTNY